MFAQLGLNVYEFVFAVLFTYSWRIFQHINQFRLVFFLMGIHMFKWDFIKTLNPLHCVSLFPTVEFETLIKCVRFLPLWKLIWMQKEFRSKWLKWSVCVFCGLVEMVMPKGNSINCFSKFFARQYSPRQAA